MEPMLGLDAKFLYSETPTTHMHTLKVAVFDMTALARRVLLRADAWSCSAVDSTGSPRSAGGRCRSPWASATRCGWRTPTSTCDATSPAAGWPQPGGDRELAAVVADVAGRPLHRDRPLWEIVVVEGLAGDRLAVVAKVHHAVADGSATVALLLHALGSEGPTPAAGAGEWHPEAIPTRVAAPAGWRHATMSRGCASFPSWPPARFGVCAPPRPAGGHRRRSRRCRSTRRGRGSTCRSPRSGPSP